MPVVANTSALGMFLVLIPKTVHDRGKAGSQLTLKCVQVRQFGAFWGVSDMVPIVRFRLLGCKMEILGPGKQGGTNGIRLTPAEAGRR